MSMPRTFTQPGTFLEASPTRPVLGMVKAAQDGKINIMGTLH